MHTMSVETKRELSFKIWLMQLMTHLKKYFHSNRLVFIYLLIEI